MGIIRLLLALAVVVAHSAPLFGIQATETVGPLGAVQMFFMTSGFYMALVLNRKYRGPDSVRLFYSNRFLRLYPTYALVAALTFLAGWIFHLSTGHSIAPFPNWSLFAHEMSWRTMLTLVGTNLVILGQDVMMFLGLDPHSGALYFTAHYREVAVPAWQFMIVPAAWTLGVELLFYLLAPWVVRRRVWIIAGVALGGIALRALLVLHFRLSTDPWNYRFFPTELPLFLAGVLAYKGYDQFIAGRPFKPWTGYAALIALVVLILGFAAPVSHWRALRPVAYLIYVSLLPLVFHSTKDRAFDRWLGELSYPLYLCHGLVIEILLASHLGFFLSHLGECACLFSLLLTIFLERWVDRPLDHFRQKRVASKLARIAAS